MGINIKRDNNVFIYEIDQDANTFEVELARKGLEKKNQILSLIRDGEDLFTCTYPVQTMYEFNMNDNNYTISNSNNKTKLRAIEKNDNLLHEFIITIDYENKKYNVLKYIHDLNRSTQDAKYFDNTNNGNLSFDEAKEIILSILSKIKNINVFNKYVVINKCELFFKDLDLFNTHKL